MGEVVIACVSEQAREGETEMQAGRGSQFHNRQSPRSPVGALSAGAGSGALVVVLAQQLPDSNRYKVPLMCLAPALPLIGIVWQRLGAALTDAIQNWRLSREFKRTRATAETILNNNMTSEEHKRQIRQHMEEIETLMLVRAKERIKWLSRTMPEEVFSLPTVLSQHPQSGMKQAS